MFVIFNDETTIRHKNRKTRRGRWATERSAKAEMTRARLDPTEWKIADEVFFENNIELKVRRKSINGGWVTVRVNTPAYLDPSCESYWSA